ncbi:hypothetical protein QQS21_000615 [Conoideocrella luteorostrata]|uniref:Uncharacterized protein n=1 Tax=Conoideocrella luteorostrata TaxID=1105319 RepID=A0AAJ0CYF4_9HYPO|nr:hypothetical protein QQS21_000615 [Conoideocrella luteorostrata]
MDSSPVVKAHDHAAAAAVATRQSADTTVAINEHTLAAGEFANAAQRTSSIEALRTLKLLEEHHRRLAELLKLPSDQTSQNSEEDMNEKSGQNEKGAASPENTQSGKKLPSLTQRGFTAREMSTSIASNLASARGIRSKYRGQPLSPSVSNDQAPGNVDHQSRRDGSKSKMQSIIDTQPGKPAWVPPTSTPALHKADSRSNKSAASSPRVDQTNASAVVAEDAGYTRFYSTFGSLINKISAPLAFAGLPLIHEESTASEQSVEQPVEQSPPPRRKASRSPAATSSLSLDPDLSKIYSKATMRALAREGHSANDSFYVVPTSGHTMSYANILSYAEKEKRRLGASHHSDLDLLHNPEDEDDDFVDARETPVPVSPGAKRKMVLSKTEKSLRNTIEELSLENKSLKGMLDNVSKRLHAFEASSQHSAMALAESFRIMRPDSPSAAQHPVRASSADEALKKKTQDMEEQLAAATVQMERLEKDNRKMQKTLEKYRDKWEVLKAGAKARREAQAENVEDA